MTGCLPRKTSLHFIMSVGQVKSEKNFDIQNNDFGGHICHFPLWLRTWFSWWLLPCWRTSISISSVVSAKRSSRWRRQADWKPLSCILSAYQQNEWEREGRTFWTYIQIKPTTLKYSLNKQYFFVVIIFPIGFGWGFYAYGKNQEPQKSPKSMDKYQNVTSIYKSKSQRIMLRNWGFINLTYVILK